MRHVPPQLKNPEGVVAATGNKQIGAITAQDRGESVTVVVTINAEGNYFTCLIFPKAQYHN